MAIVNIPPFVKRMGYKILSFILNVEDSISSRILDGQYELDEPRIRIMNEFIQICRQLRIQNIDQEDVDFHVFHTLSRVVQNGRHIFNIWHEELGGAYIDVLSIDSVVASASKIALEVYPLLLIDPPKDSFFYINTQSHVTFRIWELSERQNLIDAVKNDTSMSKLFTEIGNNDNETQIQYSSSTGRGGMLQLAVFPTTLIAKAYELMKIRGELSRETLIKSVEEVIGMLRNVGDGNQINVPAFVGFNNVGLDGLSEITIENGKIRAYNQELIALLPDEAKPSTLAEENAVLGFLLEYEYPYKVILEKQDYQDQQLWPPELDLARGILDTIVENISFSLALSIHRDPPIGITKAWTLVFDPLSQGMVISWSYGNSSPMPYYILKATEAKSVEKWSKLVAESDDEKIRIAIRRILSSINDRLNPIDGFIDCIIAWENLFGGNAELSYRISVAIAKLLATDQKERLDLQKKLVRYYNERSRIVHGSNEVTYESAAQKRNECLSIILKALRNLYEHHHDLLADSERSKKLALL